MTNEELRLEALRLAVQTTAQGYMSTLDTTIRANEFLGFLTSGGSTDDGTTVEPGDL